MTKRDVAVWFCKVVALVGMASAASGMLARLIGLAWWSGPGGVVGYINIIYLIPVLALSVFLWLFAVGIGTELAAEGEHGPLITSASEIAPLLLRCAGLLLFLTAAPPLASLILQLAYWEWTDSILTSKSPLLHWSTLNASIYALQSTFGFLLAFTPRIRLFFSK